MNKETYYRGIPGCKFGIYNTVKKEFQFDIYEDTPMLAEARLFQKIGNDARKWKFEPRKVYRVVSNKGVKTNANIFLPSDEAADGDTSGKENQR